MIDVAEWSWKQIEQTIRDGAEVAVYVLRQMPTGILIIEAERVFSSRTIAVEKPTIFVRIQRINSQPATNSMLNAASALE
jgi:hypothetical protein